MKHSEQIQEIAAALSKAQGELEDASKDGKANYGKFATLAAVLQEIRPVFSKYGLAIVQVPWTNKDNAGAFTLTTTLVHSSGQWMSGELELILDKSNMQGIGSAISYARRYMASAMSGVSQEDDDADLASKPGPVAKKLQEPAKPANEGFMSEGRRKMLFACMNEANWNETELKLLIKHQFGLDSTKLLNKDQFELLIAHLKAKKSPTAEISHENK